MMSVVTALYERASDLPVGRVIFIRRCLSLLTLEVWISRSETTAGDLKVASMTLAEDTS